MSRSFSTAFLDRDGVLNEPAARGEYITKPAQLRLCEGAGEAVRMLNQAGITVIVVTNQRGIALGRMSEADLDQIHQELEAQLERAGAHLDAIYHCPHQHDVCDCRKPAPGLFLRARADHPQIDFAQSIVVGDSPGDMQAADAIGANAMLIGSQSDGRHELAPSLLAAVRSMLGSRAA